MNIKIPLKYVYKEKIPITKGIFIWCFVKLSFLILNLIVYGLFNQNKPKQMDLNVVTNFFSSQVWGSVKSQEPLLVSVCFNKFFKYRSTLLLCLRSSRLNDSLSHPPGPGWHDSPLKPVSPVELPILVNLYWIDVHSKTPFSFFETFFEGLLDLCDDMVKIYRP